MEHLSSDTEQQQEQLQWRRDKVQELCSKGYSPLTFLFGTPKDKAID
jgi:hypothetical protein